MVILRLGRPKPAESQPLSPVSDPLESFMNVLNRDQRTAITIDRTDRSEGSESFRRVRFLRFERGSSRPPSEISNRCADGFSEKITSRSRGPRRRLACLMYRLGEVFIVGVCLLTIVRVPTVMSAPSTDHTKTNEELYYHKPTENAPSYWHPCGKHHEEEMNKMAARESDSNIIKPIIIRTKNALTYAESFRERYVEKTFHIRYKTHHAQWATDRYDWLPNEANYIPKSLSNNINPIHLKSKTLDEFLLNIYKYLQIFAVGLEQIVADQKRTEGEFHENFRVMEVRLRSVLCEIRSAIVERDLSPREQVPRSIMGKHFRCMEQPSSRNLRDWFIFRDLMNGLEYVIQVLTFFDAELSKEGESS